MGDNQTSNRIEGTMDIMRPNHKQNSNALTGHLGSSKLPSLILTCFLGTSMAHHVKVTCLNNPRSSSINTPRSSSTIWEESEPEEPEYSIPPPGQQYVSLAPIETGRVQNSSPDPLDRTVPAYVNVAGTVSSVAARTPRIGLEERRAKQQAEVERLNRQINDWKLKIKEARAVKDQHVKELFKLKSTSNKHHCEICGIHCSW